MHIVGRAECFARWNSQIEQTPAENAVNVFADNDQYHVYEDSEYNTPDVRLQAGQRPRESPGLENPVAAKIRRTTIEDSDDEDEGHVSNNRRYFETFPDVNAGHPLKEGKTYFEIYRQNQQEDGMDKWAPFTDE